MEVIRRNAGDTYNERYARAVALFRRGETDRALELVDGLMAERPDDPYLQELRGQVLFESGRVADAVEPYRVALAGRPDSALIRFGLGRALLESPDPGAVNEAASLLREVVRLEPENAFAWRFLGVAEGRLGNQGRASLALAENAVLLRKPEDAELYLRRARQHVQPNDPEWVHLQDLELAAGRLGETA